jgi:hypothetical protein
MSKKINRFKQSKKINKSRKLIKSKKVFKRTIKNQRGGDTTQTVSGKISDIKTEVEKIAKGLNIKYYSVEPEFFEGLKQQNEQARLDYIKLKKKELTEILNIGALPADNPYLYIAVLEKNFFSSNIYRVILIEKIKFEKYEKNQKR